MTDLYDFLKMVDLALVIEKVDRPTRIHIMNILIYGEPTPDIGIMQASDQFRIDSILREND